MVEPPFSGDELPPDSGESAPAEENRIRGLVPTLEALLFAAEEPLTGEELAAALPAEDRPLVPEAIRRLGASLRSGERGVQVVQVAGGFRMTTRPEHDRHLRALFRQRQRVRLGRAALETLAIIAYRQPVTAPEIAEIRGKDPTAVLHSLLERGLIRTQGRKKVVGKPFLYVTTPEFLVHFGLDSLDDLPSIEEFSALLGPLEDAQAVPGPVPGAVPAPTDAGSAEE